MWMQTLREIGIRIYQMTITLYYLDPDMLSITEAALFLWKSKMQSEISLSTTEAEYIALSQSMRDLIPLMNIIEEIDDIFEIKTETPVICCKVFEDNNGALELATSQK